MLIQGIFARNVTQDEVVQRVRSVWPKLSISWLGARMEEVARTGLPRWMDQAFWAAEIDPILLSGIQNASQCRREAVEMVLHAFPQLPVGVIWDRLRRLRRKPTADLQAVATAFVVANGGNDRVEAGGGQADFERDSPIGRDGAAVRNRPTVLGSRTGRSTRSWLRGIRTANRLERETVDRVLRKFSWNCGSAQFGRVFDAYRNNEKKNGHTGPPFRWTNELDERLIHIHEEAGLSAAVSGVQSLTGWPRKAILRRAHKLGLPTRPLGSRRRWTMVEYRFVIESLNHMSVREIAEQIERSEKAVWDMVGQRGIPARFQDGYTMRELAGKTSHEALERSEMGLKPRPSPQEKENGRIDEAILAVFLLQSP